MGSFWIRFCLRRCGRRALKRPSQVSAQKHGANPSTGSGQALGHPAPALPPKTRPVERATRHVYFKFRIYFLPAAATDVVGSAPSQVSSEVGPYTDGTGFLSIRRYMVSWAR